MRTLYKLIDYDSVEELGLEITTSCKKQIVVKMAKEYMEQNDIMIATLKCILLPEGVTCDYIDIRNEKLIEETFGKPEK